MRTLGLSLLYAHAAHRLALPPRMMAVSADSFKPMVQELANGGAAREECESLTSVYLAAALNAVYDPPPPPPPAPPPLGVELRQPKTPSDGQVFFREAFAGKLVTAPTKRFLDRVIEDRCVIFNFQYSRVYALGLTALCDAFLPATCMDAADADATRQALCCALGLDASTIANDAAALRAEASGSTRAALLASDDLTAVASAPRFKYTYAFGVGLIMLMRACGEAKIRKCCRIGRHVALAAAAAADVACIFDLSRAQCPAAVGMAPRVRAPLTGPWTSGARRSTSSAHGRSKATPCGLSTCRMRASAASTLMWA